MLKAVWGNSKASNLQARETVNEEDIKKAIQLVILPRADIQDQQEQSDEQPPPPPPPPQDQQQEEDQEEEEDDEDKEQDEQEEQEDKVLIQPFKYDAWQS